MVPSKPESVVDVRRCISPFSRRDPPGYVVWLRGEHDLSTVGAVSDALAFASGLDDDDLVVDLSEVSLMAAATVGVLRRTRDLLGIQSRSLVLRSPSRRARQVLELCGDADLIDLRPFGAEIAATPAGRKAP